jgi:C4-dicarboxylate transporter DctM subunit
MDALQLIVVLVVLYIVLGLFLDGVSITVLTLPVALPLVLAAGFDPVWFGVFLVIMVELGLVTPPVGLNLFVVQGLTGRSLSTVAVASLPFFTIMLLLVVLIAVFPELALWLPRAILS